MMKRKKGERYETHKPDEETVYANVAGPWIMVWEEFMRHLST
jgi:hypothetical protein